MYCCSIADNCVICRNNRNKRVDTMRKVLIWDISFRDANVGGPSGYLYNIREYIHANPNEQIVFLSDLLKQNAKNDVSPSSSETIKDRLKKSKLFSRINDLLFIVWKEYHVCNVHLPSSVKLKDYDFVHFHQANDVRRYASLLQGTHCKTILTTHCPCPRTDEILASRPWYYRIFAPWIRWQERMCYEQADYLMFPCKEAREPYEKDKRIRATFHAMEHKFFYCPTAIREMPLQGRNIQHLSDIGIPSDAFVIAYFGRHSSIKGYDVLKQVGDKLLDKYPNLYFLCAGRGELSPLSHPRWIEMGFIDNTSDLLPQCDLYILPNRETYFDLIVLEVLRAAVPIILSDNGGNRYFKSLPSSERSGMTFFDPKATEVLCRIVEQQIQYKMSSAEKYKEHGVANNLLWQHYFTMPTYMRNYIEQIEQI